MKLLTVWRTDDQVWVKGPFKYLARPHEQRDWPKDFVGEGIEVGVARSVPHLMNIVLKGCNHGL